MEDKKVTYGVVTSTAKLDKNQMTEKIYLVNESGEPVSLTNELPEFPDDHKVYNLQLEENVLSWVEVV